jgi:hypothetical protein
MERTKSACQAHIFIGEYVHTIKAVVISCVPEDMRNRHWADLSNWSNAEASLPIQCFNRNRQLLGQIPPVHIEMQSPRTSRHFAAPGLAYSLIALLLCLLATPINAVFINFENCLSQSYQSSNPPALQFSPLFVNAIFNTTDPQHKLTVTVWGNVSGAYTQVKLPPPTDLAWNDPKFTDGKIENLTAPYTKLTTLSKKINVLTYEPWKENSNFCGEIVNGSCPLGPSFFANA